MPMTRTEISASRKKTALTLAISLGFVATGWATFPHADADPELWKSQLVILFFGLCSVVALWLLIRPQRLLLDDEGFIVTGGLTWSQRKIYWRDIDSFFLYRLPKGGKMIGFNYKPEARKDSILSNIARQIGADGALPKGWPLSDEQMVEELNARRLQAVSPR